MHQLKKHQLMLLLEMKETPQLKVLLREEMTPQLKVLLREEMTPQLKAQLTALLAHRKRIPVPNSASMDNVIMLNVNTSRTLNCAQLSATPNVQCAGSSKIHARTTAPS